MIHERILELKESDKLLFEREERLNASVKAREREIDYVNQQISQYQTDLIQTEGNRFSLASSYETESFLNDKAPHASNHSFESLESHESKQVILNQSLSTKARLNRELSLSKEQLNQLIEKRSKNAFAIQEKQLIACCFDALLKRIKDSILCDPPLPPANASLAEIIEFNKIDLVFEALKRFLWMNLSYVEDAFTTIASNESDRISAFLQDKAMKQSQILNHSTKNELVDMEYDVVNIFVDHTIQLAYKDKFTLEFHKLLSSMHDKYLQDKRNHDHSTSQYQSEMIALEELRKEETECQTTLSDIEMELSDTKKSLQELENMIVYETVSLFLLYLHYFLSNIITNFLFTLLLWQTNKKKLFIYDLSQHY